VSRTLNFPKNNIDKTTKKLGEKRKEYNELKKRHDDLLPKFYGIN